MGRRYRVHVKKYYDVTEEMPFQEQWLLQVMNRCMINSADLAKKLHITRQAVSNWLLGNNQITFMAIAAICHVTGIDDDPERIFNEIKEKGWKK